MSSRRAKAIKKITNTGRNVITEPTPPINPSIKIPRTQTGALANIPDDHCEIAVMSTPSSHCWIGALMVKTTQNTSPNINVKTISP